MRAEEMTAMILSQQEEYGEFWSEVDRAWDAAEIRAIEIAAANASAAIDQCDHDAYLQNMYDTLAEEKLIDHANTARRAFDAEYLAQGGME